MPLISCPGCEGLAQPLFEKLGAHYQVCPSCTLEFQSPLPSLESLLRYYDDSYTSGLYKVFSAARLMKRLTAIERLREIDRFFSRGSLLDIGAGPGVFVAEARKKGIEARGVELSAIAVAEARNNGIPVEQATIESFRPDKKFDTLTAFDVIEHVLNPVGFLSAAAALLKPNGKLILTTPNTKSLSCKLMGRRWYFYIPEEHLYLFNRRSIERMLARCGFRLIHCGWTFKPLTFDYSLIQFQAYNKLIYSFLRPLQLVLPQAIRSVPVPLYIGEMLVVAVKDSATFS